MTIYREVKATLPLKLPPQLASWDAAGSASQARLAAYLTEAEELLRPAIDSTSDPLGLHLAIGLPADPPQRTGGSRCCTASCCAG